MLWPAALAAAAVALLVWSWRGRRVGGHTHCRRCGFDLYGNPAADRCGECGADLTRPRAVVVGRRKRRPALAATAIVVTLACVAWGGFSARSAGWFDRKPDWLLRWELGSDARRPAALDELIDRIGHGRGFGGDSELQARVTRLADSAARRLVGVAGNPDDFDDECRDFLLTVWFYMSPPARRDVAAALLPLLDADAVAVASRAVQVLLKDDFGGGSQPAEDIGPALAAAAKMLIDRQGDRGRTWEDGFGTLVVIARREGDVGDADWSRFARQMIAPRMYVRGRNRAGDPLPWGIGWGSYRGDGSLHLYEHWESNHVGDLDLQPFDYKEFQPSSYVTDQDGPPTDPWHSDLDGKLPVGRHVMGGAITFRVAEGDDADGPIAAEWRMEWAVPFEVVPAEQDVVRAVPAPGLAAAFAEVKDVHAWLGGDTVWISGEVGPLPADVAARGYLEEPVTGRRWEVGTQVLRRGLKQKLGLHLRQTYETPEAERLAAGATVNLILVPDADAARRTVDIINYADVTLRIDGLVIGRG